MHSSKQTFTKEERLKSRILIGDLFTKGHVIYHYPFKVLYLSDSNLDFKYPAKMGVSVSKRNFKRAVDRNRLKRKIREAYRLNKNDLYSILDEHKKKIYFFIIYTTTKDIEYREIEKEMKKLIQKFSDKIGDN